MPPLLHITKESIGTVEQRANYTVGLIGCSQKTIFTAIAFAEGGFKVKCTDADQSITRRISKGNVRLGNRETEAKLKSLVRSEQVAASSDLKAVVSASDAIILTVNTKVDDKKTTNSSEAESICKQIGAILPRGSLFIYAGLGGFGFTEDIAKINLENTSGLKAGVDFGLSYCPLEDATLQQTTQSTTAELLVAADDKISLDSCATLLETVAKHGVKRTLGTKSAELATIFRAVTRDSNTAMANELAVFCEAAGVDCVDVFKLMDTNNLKASNQPTISEESNRNEAYMLLENAENLNLKLKLPLIARQVNEDMVRHAINLTQDAMRLIGKPLRRGRVALLGASFEAGTGFSAFVAGLETKGAKVTLYDPYSTDAQSDQLTTKRTLNETAEGADCVVVLSEQEQLKRLNLKKLRAIMKSPAAFIDLTSQFDPEKVEEAGFTYRGLGRGIWKK